MSTIAPQSPATAVNPALLDSEQFIDEHIDRTRRALKLVDLSGGLIVFAVGLLAFLLVAGVIDHWVAPGGLGVVGRTSLFGVLLVGAAWYCWRQFLPLVRAINPVYAAHMIEKGAPSLKNSLLNLLIFRRGRQQMPAKVYHALEQQAAQRLSTTPTDGAIDRGALLRMGYALVIVIAACALYSVLSPKNLATSAGRVLAPWADIPAPSRVKILDIRPGDTTVARGERVSISAEVLGARDDEPVRLRYSSDDEQLVEETVVMNRSEASMRYEAELPRAVDASRAAGVQQDLTYWIEAGDARSRRLKIRVYSRPTIVVQQVTYEYPAYTGRPSTTVDNAGDISGLEGTRVTIHALANQQIESAAVDFDADGRNDLGMNVDGDRAVASFQLALRPDRRTPVHPSYVLRFSAGSGRTNSDPAKYSIEVTPDYAPEIRLIAPEEPELAVRADDTVLFHVEARDVDFALQHVQLVGRVGDKKVDVGELLAKPHEGRFAGIKPFVPADAGLSAGAVMEYWAEARDNRRPEANLAISEHRRLRIVAPDDPAAGEQQQNPGQNGRPQPEDGQQGGDDQQSAGGEGDPQQGERQEGADGQGRDNEQQQGGGAAGGGESGDGEASTQDAAAGGESGQEAADASAQQAGGGEGSEPTGDGQNNDAEAGSSDQEAADAQPAGESGADGSRGEPSPGAAQPRERVSSKGDNDGEAFDRIREHFDQQNAQGESQGGEGQSADAREPRAEESDQRQSGEPQGANADSNPNDATEESTGAADGETNPEGEAADSSTRPSADAEASGEAADSDAQGGEGATPPQADNANTSESDGDGESPRESATNQDQGEPGAGESDGPSEGSPDVGARKPREKSPTEDAGEPPADDAEPPAGAQGKTESDSSGDQGGDVSGGGREGAGQTADETGQGAAGEHEAADQGAGASDQQGEGATGAEAGEQQTAEGQTGQSSGGQSGDGSQQGDAAARPPGDSSEGPDGGAEDSQAGGASEPSDPTAGETASGEEQSAAEGQPGDASHAPPPDDAGASQPDSDAAPEGASATPAGAPGGQPQGGGQSTRAADRDSPLSEPGGDDANLEYARQQTDLVLERLEDQLAKRKVDPDLLNSLGWSEDELRQFVDRWKGLKQRAASGEGAGEAQRALDAALRSLGFRRDGPVNFRSAATADELRNLEDAYRARTPLEYMDRVRAYVQGAAAADAERSE